jgi:hypothetical protein
MNISVSIGLGNDYKFVVGSFQGIGDGSLDPNDAAEYGSNITRFRFHIFLMPTILHPSFALLAIGLSSVSPFLRLHPSSF